MSSPSGTIVDVCAEATDAVACETPVLASLVDTCAEATDSVTCEAASAGVSGAISDTCAECTDTAAGSVDATPPTFTWAVSTDGTYVEGTASKVCDVTSTPAAGAFSLPGTHFVVTGVAWFDSTHVRLTGATGARVTDFEVPTINYTAGANPLRDTSLNNAANISGGAVTNASTFLSGAVLIMNMYRAASYTLSGSNVTHIVNEATAASHATTGSPQYVATGLNSRPSLDFDGLDDVISGTDNAYTEPFENQNAHYVMCIAQVDISDANNAFFGIGNAGVSNNGRRCVGCNTTGTGTWVDQVTNDAATSISYAGVASAVNTSPHVHEYYGSTTTTHTVDGTTDGPTPGSDLNARSYAPGATNAAGWVIGGFPASGGYQRMLDGDLSFLVEFASVPDATTRTAIRAYAYFLSGLTGS